MHDINTLQYILDVIKENYSLEEDPRRAQEVIENINHILAEHLPDVYISPSIIHEIGELVNGNVSSQSLFDALESIGQNTKERVSRHGLDMNVYRSLLPLTKLAAFFEGQEDAEMNAYKLAVLLNNKEVAVNYLKHYMSTVKLAEPRAAPFHQACLFDMPPNDEWDLNSWRVLFAKYIKESDFRAGIIAKAPQIQLKMIAQNKATLTQTESLQALESKLDEKKEELNVVDEELRNLNQKAGALRREKKEVPSEFANMIEQKSKTRAGLKAEINLLQNQFKAQKGKLAPLLETLDAKILFEEATSIIYKHAKEDEMAAYLFRKHDVPEAVFDEHIRIKSQIKNSDKQIPPIIIDGKKYGCEDCYMIKLQKGDPKCAMLGHITGCCQSLGRLGSACAHHGITSKNGGFYVLCKGKPPPDGNTSKILPKDIIAESWAWRAQDGALVLDSVECQPNMREQYATKMTKMYSALAFELVTTQEIPFVKVGTGGSASRYIGYQNTKESNPIDFKGYRDSKKQREVVNQDFPLLALFSADIERAITLFNALPQDQQSQYNEDLILDILVKKGTLEQIKRYLSGKKNVDLEYILAHDLLKRSISAKNEQFFLYMLKIPGVDEKASLELKKIYDNGLYELGKQVLNQLPEGKENEYFGWACVFGNIQLVQKILQQEIESAVLTQALADVLNTEKGNLLDKKEIVRLLITKGAVLPSQNRDAQLRKYAVETYISNVITTKGNADAVLGEGKTLLMFAVENGLEDNVRDLLTYGASMFPIDESGKSALDTAIWRQNNTITDLFLNEWFDLIEQGLITVDAPDEKGMTLLMYAVQTNRTLLVKELIQRGADIDVTALNGKTSLHFAAEAGQSTNIAVLLDKGATLEVQDNDNKTPFQLAFEMMKNEAIRALVLAGADIDTSLNSIKVSKPLLDAVEEKFHLQGLSAKMLLPIAVNEKHYSLIRRILAGWYNETTETNINDVDEKGKTLLMWASETGNLFLVRKLLEKGASVHVTDKSGNSALHFAAESGHAEIVKVIAEQGADLFLKNQREETPIKLAILADANLDMNAGISEGDKKAFEMKIKECIRHIIKAWASQAGEGDMPINPADPEGKTLLMWAAEFGMTDVLNKIVSRKVPLGDKDNEGVSALEHAIRGKQSEAVDILLERGAAIEDQTLYNVLPYLNRDILIKLINAQASFQSDNILRMIDYMWAEPQQKEGFREVRELMLDYIFSTACFQSNMPELQKLLDKGLQNEISSTRLMAMLCEATTLNHLEVVSALLTIDKVLTKVMKNKEVKSDLMKNEGTKLILESALKGKEPLSNPFIRKKQITSAFRTEQSAIDQLRATLWDNLVKDPLLMQTYPQDGERNKMAAAVARLCVGQTDQMHRRVAVKNLAQSEEKSEVLNKLLDKYDPQQKTTNAATVVVREKEHLMRRKT